MKGVILSAGTAQGLILGDDEVRYTFTPLGWRDKGTPPAVGMRVDFEVRGSRAVGIYPISGPVPTPPAAPEVPPAPPTTALPPTPGALPPTSGTLPTPGALPPTPGALPMPGTASGQPAGLPPSGLPTAQGAAPAQPPPPPPATTGFAMAWWHWAGAAGALVVVGIVGAVALGLFEASDPQLASPSTPQSAASSDPQPTAPAAQQSAAPSTPQSAVPSTPQSAASSAPPPAAPSDPQSFNLEWKTSETNVEAGESFLLTVRMHGVRQPGERGGISVSFPSLTESSGPNDWYSTPAADVEAVEYTSGMSNVTFHQPGATIYHRQGNRQFPADYLLVESDDPSWSSSADRSLALLIVPKRSGEFPIQIRGWLCSDGYTSCERNPSSGTPTDQQGWVVDQASVTVTILSSSAPAPAPTPARISAPAPTALPTPAATTAQTPPVSLRLSAGESGSLEHHSGARIEIPGGATDEAVTVSITEVEPPHDKLPSGVELGRVFDISIGQAELARPVVIHIPYEHKPGMKAEDVRALHWDEDVEKWEMLDGVVDETNRQIRVEVSKLSPFLTIVRPILGYDYTEDAAEFRSCSSDPESPGAVESFNLTADVINHSVEHKMYVEFTVEDRLGGVSKKIESPSALLEVGETHEFSSEWLMHLSSGELSVECVLKVGIPSGVPHLSELMINPAYMLDWLAPDLDREAVSVSVGAPPKYVMELALKYAPVLRMHPDEKYLPRGVEWFVEQSDLKDGGDNTITGVSMDSLGTVGYDQSHYLDAPDNIKDQDIDHLPATVYWTIRVDGSKDSLYLQYYLFYNYDYLDLWQLSFCDMIEDKDFDIVYNLFCLPHEADWELIQFEFKADDAETIIERGITPVEAAYSQHFLSEAKAYNDVETYDGHPVAYAALGKHANYFDSWAASIVLDEISDEGIMLLPQSGGFDGVQLCHEVLPQAESCSYELHFIDQSTPWVAYKGKWGGSEDKIPGPDEETRWNEPHSWSQRSITQFISYEVAKRLEEAAKGFIEDNSIGTATPSVSVPLVGESTVSGRQPFNLEWEVTESSVEAGKEFILTVRMHGAQQPGEHGGISVSFPSLTESGGSKDWHSSADATVEALDYTSGLPRVTFHQPGATIYHRENNRKFPADYLLVESNDPTWERSSDRSLILAIAPKRSGEFPIQIRGWLCQDEYTDCARNPDSGAATDQQGHAVVQVPVSVVAPSTGSALGGHERSVPALGARFQTQSKRLDTRVNNISP